MKNLGYNLVKVWIKASLYLYHGKIKVSGLENIPKDKPVLFLPNHQSALLDVLLIAVDCVRKPYFLTRSDVFTNRALIAIFDYFQMIPIYRIRDGRDSLKNNQAVFERCAKLLERGEALLMFPEANHNLRRRVRPLSKGFTRILFAALEKQPNLDIQLVPVGLNYRNATAFPDQMAINYGKAIPLQDFIVKNDQQVSIAKIKAEVTGALLHLTTHIDDEENYDTILERLEAKEINFLYPKKVNATIEEIDISSEIPEKAKRKTNVFFLLLKLVFTLLNFPMLLLWRTFGKPKVWEPEFMGTLRFAFALLAYPMYYLLLFLVVGFLLTWSIGLASAFGLFLFNFMFVKSTKI
ncbi:lysophospholipid acyltransferase family protein [Maribacter halichondriae]|uniref:lysophospholipid acyltransferase family protein n=1 Tax=Maribacter halichondriae TaxID=2980554 RepID=UPI00235928E9|nr:lysophospholipid acyltransferase family protein [Maribacter sp. Hal144]